MVNKFGSTNSERATFNIKQSLPVSSLSFSWKKLLLLAPSDETRERAKSSGPNCVQDSPDEIHLMAPVEELWALRRLLGPVERKQH